MRGDSGKRRSCRYSPAACPVSQSIAADCLSLNRLHALPLRNTPGAPVVKIPRRSPCAGGGEMVSLSRCEPKEANRSEDSLRRFGFQEDPERGVLLYRQDSIPRADGGARQLHFLRAPATVREVALPLDDGKLLRPEREEGLQKALRRAVARRPSDRERQPLHGAEAGLLQGRRDGGIAGEGVRGAHRQAA